MSVSLRVAPELPTKGCYSDAYMNRTDEGDMECLPSSLRRIEVALRGLWDEFDVIFVTGLSGIIPGAILAHKYGKQLVVVRKDDDITHGVRTEGRDFFAPGTPYIILDDVVSSGRTLMRLFDKAVELEYGLPRFIVLYRGMSIWGKDLNWNRFKMEFDYAGRRGLFTPRVTKERT